MDKYLIIISLDVFVLIWSLHVSRHSLMRLQREKVDLIHEKKKLQELLQTIDSEKIQALRDYVAETKVSF